MYKKNKVQEGNNQNKVNKVAVKGVVVEDLQDTRYKVEISLPDAQTHTLIAYPGGQLRSRYKGRIMVGDEVTVEIDPPYIDIGIIKFKHNRKPVISN